jgi:O-antigen/teichoic acid export membrane protein
MKLPWRLSEDHLVRNALFLLLSSGTMGTFGFVFWLLAAHLYSSVSVGQAATVIAAMTVISYISDLGLTNTLIRFLPTSQDPDAEINTALILTTVLAMVIATCYLLIAPNLVPNIRFLRENPLTAVGFVLLNGCAAANLLTDSVFIANRRSQYNFLVDGVMQGVVKLGCLGGFVGIASYGIFVSNGIGAAVAVAASLVFMFWRVGYHPRLKVDLAVFTRTLHFSLTNYVSSVFQLLPLLFLPIIVVNGDGPRGAAYFFIAFNLANLAYAVSFAMGASLFAEGSQGKADIPGLARRAAKLLLPVTIGIALVLGVAAHWILKIYGTEYAQDATSALIVLLAALPIVALNNFGQVLLKLRNRLITMIIVNLSSFVVILGLATLWSSKGLSWIAFAWLLGNLIAALMAWAGWLVPPRSRPRHAMGSRQRRRAKRRRQEDKRRRQEDKRTLAPIHAQGGRPL